MAHIDQDTSTAREKLESYEGWLAGVLRRGQAGEAAVRPPLGGLTAAR